MDIFASKDQEMQRLEKRLSELERKIKKDFSRFEQSFAYLQQVAESLHNEHVQLRRDRETLLQKYKHHLRRMDIPLAPEVAEKIKGSIKETAGLMKDIVLEEIDVEPKKKHVDDLFELVMRRKKISTRTAAKELGLRENTVRYMALKLQGQKLIRINQSGGKTELAKS